ncbi:hypothetical protein F1544_14845, partial [Kineosporiaceae bacterium B12]
MNQQQPSGSRWEPTDGRYPTEPLQGVVVTAPRPLDAPPPAGSWPAAPPTRDPRRRHRLVLAGAALGLV